MKRIMLLILILTLGITGRAMAVTIDLGQYFSDLEYSNWGGDTTQNFFAKYEGSFSIGQSGDTNPYYPMDFTGIDNLNGNNIRVDNFSSDPIDVTLYTTESVTVTIPGLTFTWPTLGTFGNVMLSTAGANSFGFIVGGNRGNLWLDGKPIPEPATVISALLGILGFAVKRFIRK